MALARPTNRSSGPAAPAAERRRWTAVSAIAILDGGPRQVRGLRVYHNVYAAVRLDPGVFGSLPVSQMVLPDATDLSP